MGTQEQGVLELSLNFPLLFRVLTVFLSISLSLKGASSKRIVFALLLGISKSCIIQ